MRVGRFLILTVLALLAVFVASLVLREFYVLYYRATPELRLGVLTAIGSGIALIWTICTSPGARGSPGCSKANGRLMPNFLSFSSQFLMRRNPESRLRKRS